MDSANTLLDRESYNNTRPREINMMHKLIISNRCHQVPSPLLDVDRVVIALCRRCYYRASLCHQVCLCMVSRFLFSYLIPISTNSLSISFYITPTTRNLLSPFHSDDIVEPSTPDQIQDCDFWIKTYVVGFHLSL